MAPKYKLTYFDLYALGEPIKFLLLYGKLEYEFRAVTFEEWGPLKPTVPFGKLPLLEFDGKVMDQSTSICRYLGKQLGIAGDNDMESAMIDAVADTITDMRLNFFPYIMESNDDVAEEKRKELKTVHYPFYLERLDKMVQENNGYFVNGKLSWADLFFAALHDYLCFTWGGDEMLANYKNLQQLHHKVTELPAINNYLNTRPHKPYYSRSDIKAFLQQSKEKQT